MVRKPKNMENKKHTVGRGIYRETLKKVKKNAHCRTSKMAIKRKKLETHRIGPGIWQETLKKVENKKHTVGAGIWREN